MLAIIKFFLDIGIGECSTVKSAMFRLQCLLPETVTPSPVCDSVLSNECFSRGLNTTTTLPLNWGKRQIDGWRETKLQLNRMSSSPGVGKKALFLLSFSFLSFPAFPANFYFLFSRLFYFPTFLGKRKLSFFPVEKGKITFFFLRKDRKVFFPRKTDFTCV